MNETKEITALFNLLDDPDEEIFQTVAERIIHYGKPILPNLENLWETTAGNQAQYRIELLIHKVHFKELYKDFKLWAAADEPDILSGAVLMARFQHPEMDIALVLQEVEKMRRNIWLELNNYLTSLEKVNVLGTILYHYYSLKGKETSYLHPQEFLLNTVIENKLGNAIGNGMLYLLMAELLDINVKAINIPKQFLLAYFDTEFDFEELYAEGREKIQFYIDPLTGNIYNQKDIETYLERIAIPPDIAFFSPLSSKGLMQHVLKEYSKCFDAEDSFDKKEELNSLIRLLESPQDM